VASVIRHDVGCLCTDMDTNGSQQATGSLATASSPSDMLSADRLVKEGRSDGKGNEGCPRDSAGVGAGDGGDGVRGARR
jgi:hypothetical protein